MPKYLQGKTNKEKGGLNELQKLLAIPKELKSVVKLKELTLPFIEGLNRQEAEMVQKAKGIIPFA